MVMVIRVITIITVLCYARYAYLNLKKIKFNHQAYRHGSQHILYRISLFTNTESIEFFRKEFDALRK